MSAQVEAAKMALEEAKKDVELALQLLGTLGAPGETDSFRLSKAMNRCKTIKESANEAQVNLSFHIGGGIS
jgi:AmiR/NasT family two-component response regulator